MVFLWLFFPFFSVFVYFFFCVLPLSVHPSIYCIYVSIHPSIHLSVWPIHSNSLNKTILLNHHFEWGRVSSLSFVNVCVSLLLRFYLALLQKICLFFVQCSRPIFSFVSKYIDYILSWESWTCRNISHEKKIQKARTHHFWLQFLCISRMTWQPDVGPSTQVYAMRKSSALGVVTFWRPATAGVPNLTGFFFGDTVNGSPPGRS